MYFYHEHYHHAYVAAVLEDSGSQGPLDDKRTDEPIRIPAILNWLAIVSVALCVIVAAIQGLS